jgi:SAM-dependent methyltransferase
MPKPEVLQEYYSKYYVTGNEKITCPGSARFARHIAAHSGLAARNGLIRMLDFGGGDGTLARKTADQLLAKSKTTVEIDLIDYEKPGEYSTDSIRLQGYRTLREARGPYDLVIASAVLEHIPEVNSVMRQLFALTRAGGCLYARTPCIVPLARLVRNLDFTYPGHVHDMGGGFWNRVITTFGLDAQCIVSGPSLIETTLRSHPVRTIAAALLKAPARFEGLLSPSTRTDRWWNFVGGWEIMLRFGETR